MSSCELCGKETNKLYKVKIMGSILNVCSECSSKGTLIEEKKDLSKTFYHKRKNQEEDLEIIPNYVSLINSELTKRNLDIHKFARGINIKESILSKMLSGKLKLDIQTARKIENFLEIKLIEKVEVKKSTTQILEEMKKNEENEKPLSLGDLIMQKLNEKNGNK
jgi:putative transcription factor